ncbi:nitrogenase component 1 [Anaerocolumna sp. AGMB13020]|uniref:nitrogenase component 1 n=1 Tax=Anaerocolumna sp. AGMB13020 TaxID=3081750 RepID=UPI0029548BB4|nr:nitrogenase component 1 [Anaerocolumna sp. AGMB13020]WOO35472.1 nitrogenase component 1 [Anaerocolumna sp. AGMB13020]
MKERNKHGWLPLSKINARTVIPFSGIPEDPGRHCPMHTALSLIRNISGVSTLVVGSAECGYYSRYVMTDQKGRNGELHYVYELDAGEVVFGCRKGLLEALKEMDREGAEIIMLILTCVPALIGEDMEAVIKELEGKISAKLFFVDGAHFKYNGYYPGFLDTYSGLGLLYKEAALKEEANKGERNVNLLGALLGKEGNALKECLQEAGCNLLEVNLQTIVKAAEKINKGTLNVLLDANQSLLSEKLHKPEILLCKSFEAEAIRTAYQKLFDQLEIEREDQNFLHSSYQALKEKEKQAKEVLKGIPFIMTSQELLALPTAAYLSELGMEPKLLSVENLYETDLPWKEDILKHGNDPYLVTITENNNIGHWARDYNLFSIGHCLHIPKERVLFNPAVHRIFSLTGYERSIALLDRLLELAENMEEVPVKLQNNSKQLATDKAAVELQRPEQGSAEKAAVKQQRAEQESAEKAIVELQRVEQGSAEKAAVELLRAEQETTEKTTIKLKRSEQKVLKQPDNI